MEAFGQSAMYPKRLGRFFTALTNELRSAGTTSLFTLEQSSANDLITHMAPVSAVAEYIIELRYAEPWETSSMGDVHGGHRRVAGLPCPIDGPS